MSEPIPYPKEAQAFLEDFYNGETDPEKKLKMLMEVTPGQLNFYASELRDDGAGLKEGEITTLMRIGSLEQDILWEKGLIKRILC